MRSYAEKEFVKDLFVFRTQIAVGDEHCFGFENPLDLYESVGNQCAAGGHYVEYTVRYPCGRGDFDRTGDDLYGRLDAVGVKELFQDCRVGGRNTLALKIFNSAVSVGFRYRKADPASAEAELAGDIDM